MVSGGGCSEAGGGMTAEEQAAAWSVPESEPWFQAVLAACDDAIGDATDTVCSMTVAGNHGHAAFAAGGLEALRVMRGEIERRRAEAFEVK